MTIQRNNSIEILRIICMYFIVLLHLCTYGFISETFKSQSTNQTPLSAITSVLIIAVNCFVLITGYFGLKFSSRKFISLGYQAVFYLVAIFSVLVLFDIFFSHKSLHEAVSGLTQFKFKGYWFIKAYLLLMLTVLFVNKLKVKWLNILFIAVFIADVVMETIHFPVSHSEGHDWLHLLFLYLLGRKINEYKDFFSMPWVVAVFVVSTSFRVFAMLYDIPFVSNSYNNLFVVISSVAFFVFFIKIDIKTNSLNAFSANMIAVYLISDNIFVRERIYAFFQSVFCSFNQYLPIYLLVVSLTIFFASYGIDFIKRKIFNVFDEFIVGKITFGAEYTLNVFRVKGMR